jgi:hypothetical protein
MSPLRRSLWNPTFTDPHIVPNNKTLLKSAMHTQIAQHHDRCAIEISALAGSVDLTLGAVNKSFSSFAPIKSQL